MLNEGAGEMTQCLKTHTPLAEIPSTVPTM